MTNDWVCPLTGVADTTGDFTQLYHQGVAAGVAKAGSTYGQKIRVPRGTTIHSIQLQSDGTNGGTLEIWDASGEDAGIDVSSAQAITAAQLAALAVRGLATKIYQQDYPAGVGSGVKNAAGVYRLAQRGVVVRLISAGSATLNLVCDGRGGQYTMSLGGY